MKATIKKCSAVIAPALTVLALLSIGAPLQAQGNAQAQALVEARTKRMATELKLTPDQTEKLKQLNIQTVQHMATMKEASTGGKMDSMKALASLEEQRRAELGKFLTPDQMKKYAKVQRQDLAMLRTERMAYALKLNSDQTKKIDKINLTLLEQYSKAKTAPTRMEMGRKMREANDKHEADVKKVLTPEQWQGYQSMKSK